MKKNRIADLILLPLIIGLIIFGCFYAYQETKLLYEKLNDREQYILKLENKNKLQEDFFKSKLDSIVTLSHNEGFTMNGKTVSASSIIKAANQWYTEKESLKIELENCKEIQKAYEGGLNKASSMAVEQAKRGNENAKLANENAKLANSYLDIVNKFSPEKYKEYEFFYKTVKKDFGLDYEVEKLNDSTRVLKFKPNSKLDSALGYFDAFKNGRIKTNIIFKDETKRKKN